MLWGRGRAGEESSKASRSWPMPRAGVRTQRGVVAVGHVFTLLLALLVVSAPALFSLCLTC